MGLDVVPIIAVACALACGCSREPIDIACPDVVAGELVVTEIRGPQSSDDAYGQWLEIYNASAQTVDVAGLEIAIYKLDGSSESQVLVRRPLALEPGSYAVVGRQLEGQEPSHVDYGYVTDFDRDLFDSGAIEVVSCGALVDVVVYRNLPSRGTLSLDGDATPTAALNDDGEAWCVDAEEDEMTPSAGIRGTPRERNRPCADQS